ncbi:hypothetical protein F5H01DRAFT_66392 [Linnemannia elongata]|nr:hypothetical protein F5H01DRAFT_66392 [Linnemannia elongata]
MPLSLSHSLTDRVVVAIDALLLLFTFTIVAVVAESWLCSCSSCSHSALGSFHGGMCCRSFHALVEKKKSSRPSDSSRCPTHSPSSSHSAPFTLSLPHPLFACSLRQSAYVEPP